MTTLAGQKNVSWKVHNDLLFTGLNQLWRLVSGPLTLLLIPVYLSQEAQGYWFTFISLATLVHLADLGFSNIVLQFAAHEFAYLHFDDRRMITGDRDHLSKLANFFIFSVKWSGLIVAVAFPVILIAGILLLSEKESQIRWFIPWVIYVFGSAITFFNSTALYFFEGCNSVGFVQKLRLNISVVTVGAMWTCLFLDLNIYALAFSLLFSSITGVFIIYKNYGTVIRDFAAIAKKRAYSWRNEFFSLLWRYAISWASGYLIFQIYTPLAFHYHGAVQAGKVGMSVTLWMTATGIASIWIYIITPKINMHISRKEWKQLDKIFFKHLMLSLGTFILGVLAIFMLMVFLKGKILIIDRFVGIIPMVFLAVIWTSQIIINNLAVYLRAHKKEPLVLPSFVSGLYISLTTVLCAKYLSVDYFFLGFLSNYLFGLPWIFYIFYKKRKEWHTGGYSTNE